MEDSLCLPHGFGVLELSTFVPYPKNPVIGAFFREIHRADELGSGMRKMMRYSKAYGGADPQLIEGDVFRMTVKAPEFGAVKPQEITVKPESGPESIMRRVLYALIAGPLSKAELSSAIGQKSISGKLNQRIREMIADGLIEYTIPDKPNSRLQKYRLTDGGKKLVEGG